MKKLLILTMVAMVAALSFAFTPAQKPVLKSVATAHIDYTFDKALNYAPAYYRIYFNNVLTVELTSSNWGYFDIPEGTVVRMEAVSVAPPDPYYAFIAYVMEQSEGQYYYKDTPGNIDYTFTAEAGKSYGLFVKD
jgi:hypothetical protein